MLDKDNVMSRSVSEAVEKIPTYEKDYRKRSCLFFTLYSHSIQAATMCRHFTAYNKDTNI